jgi:cytochrome c5
MRWFSATVMGVLCACGAGAESPGAASGASDKGTGAEAPPGALDDRMFRHFLDATAARDAVIAGRADGVHEPLARLAAREIGAEIPDDWKPWVAEMQAQARRAADAKTLPEAARVVAALGSTCGECHRTTIGGPKWEGDQRGYQTEGKTGLEEKMQRHLWSAEEMWLGLTAPRHQAWSRGASALMNIHVPSLVTPRGEAGTDEMDPSGSGTLQDKQPKVGVGAPGRVEAEPVVAGDAPQTTGGKLGDPVDLDAALRDLRELGKQADAARLPHDKQVIFGEIITRCGECHAKLGVRVH